MGSPLLNVDSGVLGTVPALVCLAGPALLLAAMTFLRDAPAEWARDALTAWTCIAAMVMSGALVAALGSMLLGVLVLTAFAAIAISGPWGLTIAAGMAAALGAAQLLGAEWPVHPALAPALVVAAACGAVRAHMLR